jgi:adenosylcobinamide-GDP ribazoletransferase
MLIFRDMTVALRYLTRLPTPAVSYTPDSLASAAKLFPVVGLLVGAGGAGLNRVLTSHASRDVVAVLLLVYFVLITGGLHEDGLADAADGFGAGSNKEQILEIMRDSRIGSYGAIALVLSLLARFVLLSTLPLQTVSFYIIGAHVLCRWTSLPLSFFLPPARAQEGQGAQVAQQVSLASLIFGTLFTIAVCYWAFRSRMWIPTAATTVLTLLSAFYYKSQIGGVTGDCYGATNQLAEIAVYLCGVLT